MHPLQRLENHTIKQRKVKFDFSQTPHYWIYDNPFATHLINAVHLILPIGELWMCRTFNEALPFITDEKLKSDVKGFIAQEAHHAQAHNVAQDYLRHYGYNIDGLIEELEEAFRKLGSATPLGFNVPKIFKHQWLTMRVGVAASVEHFTSMLGTWCLDTQPWQAQKADEMMSDLFTWHLAEEVEHRSVAFDLYTHLCGEKNKRFAYIQRQAIMSTVAPIFIGIIHHCFKTLAKSDPVSQQLKDYSFFDTARESVRENQASNQVPSFKEMMLSLKRWASPNYHPYYEGDTAKALQVLENSESVKRLQLRHS